MALSAPPVMTAKAVIMAVIAAAIVCSFLAWQRYDDDGAEGALTRATAATVLIGAGLYAAVVPARLARGSRVRRCGDRMRTSGCAHPVASKGTNRELKSMD